MHVAVIAKSTKSLQQECETPEKQASEKTISKQNNMMNLAGKPHAIHFSKHANAAMLFRLVPPPGSQTSHTTAPSFDQPCPIILSVRAGLSLHRYCPLGLVVLYPRPWELEHWAQVSP